jgi:uncharacterized membrane protein YvlD (DUF360 family)
MGRIKSVGMVLARALVILVVEVVSLLFLAWLLPGVSLNGWRAAVGTVIVLALLNAILRPLVLLVAANLGIIVFTLIAFLLNAVVVLLAARWVPGFGVDGWGSAFIVAFGLAGLNGLLTGLLSLNDEDSLYRNVTRRLARRRVEGAGDGRPGVAVVQIDGLAEAVLREELAAGHMPTLARWLKDGSHRLVGWECAVPSMTSAVQAGLFYGNNAGIPAFRWYNKGTGKMFVSNHPADARALDRRLATEAAQSGGALLSDGVSISNLLTGGAGTSVMTMAGMVTDEGKRQISTRDFYTYLASPYNLLRGVMGFIADVCVEYWQAWRAERKKVEPRMHRGGVFPYLRAATTVLLRDAAVWLTIDAMYRGQRVAYMDYLGYDEVAHHAGHDTEDAKGSLRSFDRHLATIEDASRRAPRPYELVVLSDHGQSTGWTFKQRYGLSLGDLVQQLIAKGSGETPTVAEGGGDEGWGHLNVLLTEIVRTEGVTGAGARRLLQGRQEAPLDEGEPDEGTVVALGPEARDRETAGDAGVAVCPSGNLANIYFTREPGRLSLEYLVATYPGLVEGLASHPGIGFVMVYSEARGHVVMGPKGYRDLDSGTVGGEDPLAHFSPNLAAQLLRISGYDNVGDLLVNSFYDPATGEVAAFEELIGCHGGAGGPQQAPFLMYPAAWTAPAETPGEGAPQLVGADAVHVFLTRHAWQAALPAPTGAPDGGPSSSPPPGPPATVPDGAPPPPPAPAPPALAREPAPPPPPPAAEG